FGDRAIFLGVFRHLREFTAVKVRHLSAQRQSRTTDAKSFTLLLESHGGLGAELSRGKSRSLQAKRKRHCETPGVCCGNELLRIGTLLVLEAGLERIGRAGKHPGIGGKIAATVAARAAPNRFSLADHGSLLCVNDVTPTARCAPVPFRNLGLAASR